eukprot:Nitzschia sp. Nitz4//scaffold28_size193895//129885//132995//NITZ4_001671-RA/size193895-snap-gene-0.346-mRNA-1//-1//CDS//3329546000//9350//frame0
MNCELKNSDTTSTSWRRTDNYCLCDGRNQKSRKSCFTPLTMRCPQLCLGTTLLGILFSVLYVSKQQMMFQGLLQPSTSTSVKSNIGNIRNGTSHPIGNVSTLSSTASTNISSTTSSGGSGFTYQPYPYVFGLVHVAKTAGSYINSYLAAHFERVCGNKGYSYNSAANYRLVNHSVEASLSRNETPCLNFKCTYGKEEKNIKTRPRDIKAIGFEDCDYIALERKWTAWGEVAQELSKSPLLDVDDSTKKNNSSDAASVQIELHIPCRDPIDHLLSQCNFKSKLFRCSANAKVWKSNVDACVIGQRRFKYEMWEKDPLLQVKCFSDTQVTSYLEYMSNILQPRRRKVDYVSLSTNRPRNKSQECLLSDDDFASEVRAYMMERYPYYSWCQKCLAGPDNLLSHIPAGDAFRIGVLLLGALFSVLYVSKQQMMFQGLLQPSTSTSVKSRIGNIRIETNQHSTMSSTAPANISGIASSSSGFTYQPYPYVFGLVHVAKTAGSYINSYLAAHFERVCGNKGYSYNSAANYRLVNHSVEASLSRNKTPCLNFKCTYGKEDKRIIAMPSESNAIGFEDCDYIALEQSWTVWGAVAKDLANSPLLDVDDSSINKNNSSGPPSVQIELHIPCRDPIDHLLSQCNFRIRKFRCATDTREWKFNVDACMMDPGRFNYEMWAKDPLLQVKCFSDTQVTSYLEYMSGILQPRRRKVDYVSLSSNRPRNTARECLLSDDNFASEVRAYMMERYPYYSWCQNCLAGPDNLLSHIVVSNATQL